MDGDFDLVDDEVNVVEFNDVFDMDLNSLLVVNLDGLLNAVSDVFLVDLDLLDVFLGLLQVDLDLHNNLLSLGDLLDDSLLGGWFSVLKSQFQSDDSSLDDDVSVNDELSLDDQSLLVDDLSGSVDLDLEVVHLSLPVFDSQ